MATKDQLSSQLFVNINTDNSNDRYSNINLNQNYKCETQSSLQSCTSLNNDKNFYEKDCTFGTYNYERKGNLQTWNNSTAINKTRINNSKLFKDSKAETNKQKMDISCSATTKSTLSLHIAAYENLTKGNTVPGDTKKGSIKEDRTGLMKKWNKPKTIENSIEIPRQQETQESEPEIMQFKASQQLLNPAKVSLAVAAEIFKSPPGSKRSNWRSKLLHAVGFPKYIPSSNVLQSLTPLQKQIEYLKKKNIKSTWDTVSLEVGDPQEWEKLFLPEFGPHIEQNKQIELLTEAYKEGQKREAEKEKENTKLTFELEEAKKLNEDAEKRESVLLEALKETEKLESEKDKQHAEDVQNLQVLNAKKESKIAELRKLNKDKANKLNYKRVSSAMGPSQKPKEEESSPKRTKIMENKREYSMAFVMLCVQLSWMGIKDLKIPQVIHIITSFFGVDVERLPDQSTVTRWCNEQVVFIEQQINEFFENAENLTVHSDETTLAGDKLQAYIICKIVDGIRKYIVVGIEQVPDKSAARSLKAFIACMKRTVDVFRNLSEDVIEEILTERLGKIVNVVGDRASTQKKWNRDLGALTGKEMTEIFCQHYILASIWDVFVSSCLQFEKAIFNSPNLKISKIKAAVESLSTFLGERSNSNQKAKEWKAFAEKEGLDYPEIPSKFGSRWNIGFAILAVLWYHHKNILKFLTTSNYKVETCFSALMEVLETPAFMNMVRIGAAIDQVVNGPWWTEIDSEKHISEIYIANEQIIEYLKTVAEDPHLIDTELPLLTARTEKQTIFRNSALSNFNSASFDMVPVFYQNIAEYLTKQFNHLSENPKVMDDLYKEELASAAPTNKVSEQVFGVASYLRQQSSSLSNTRLGYLTTAIKNKTGKWYNDHSPKDRKKLNAAAREARKRVRRQLRERNITLKAELVESQKKKQLQQLKKKATPEGNDKALDKHLGETFSQVWEDEEGEYVSFGYVKRKEGDGYMLRYQAETDDGEEEDIESFISYEEFDTLITTKKIVFND